MGASPSGPWSAEQIRRFLEQSAIPLRLACVGADGAPHLLSLWYIHRDGSLWCATSSHARVVRMLERDPRCSFEVAGDEIPYRGVRGAARARVDAAAGDAVLRELIRRYLGNEDTPFARWRLARGRDDVALEIEPLRLSTWDFGERMDAR
jgi:nitroimidazol reductase NimA-like FMN-containing flavoprotein (pyridoxamine 5'-phosphate oxidase superfamily)